MGCGNLGPQLLDLKMEDRQMKILSQNDGLRKYMNENPQIRDYVNGRPELAGKRFTAMAVNRFLKVLGVGDHEKAGESLLSGVMTPLQELIYDAGLTGKKFTSNAYKTAGRKLKTGQREEAAKVLAENELRWNVQPPAMCNIVEVSRDLKEWDFCVLSKKIQEVMYAMPWHMVLDVNPYTGEKSSEATMTSPTTGKPIAKIPEGKEEIKDWTDAFGIDLMGVQAVGGLNRLFKNAAATYEGVLKKAVNRRNKRKERDEAMGRKSEDEPVMDVFGRLLEKPSPNPSLYLFAGRTPEAAGSRQHSSILQAAGYGYGLYRKDPNDPIYSDVMTRLPKPTIRAKVGDDNSPRNKRVRLRKGKCVCPRDPNRPKERPCKNKRCVQAGPDPAALLAVVRFGDEWIVLDVRGLLRNAMWRGVIKDRHSITVQGLLDMFSGDAVIHPHKKVAQFRYKSSELPSLLGLSRSPGSLPSWSRSCKSSELPSLLGLARVSKRAPPE